MNPPQSPLSKSCTLKKLPPTLGILYVIVNDNFNFGEKASNCNYYLQV